MKNRITLNTFRKLARTEEMVMRGMMPKASEASPEALAFFAEIENAARTSKASARTLTFKLSEVAR